MWCEAGDVCNACDVWLYIVSDDGCESHGVVCAAHGIRGAHVACVALGACVLECVARVQPAQ